MDDEHVLVFTKLKFKCNYMCIKKKANNFFRWTETEVIIILNGSVYSFWSTSRKRKDGPFENYCLHAYTKNNIIPTGNELSFSCVCYDL